MNPQILVLLIGLGAAALAFWVDVRFPSLDPESPKWALLHLIAGMALARFVAGTLLAQAGASGEALTIMLVVFGVGLPVLVYNFLVGIWLVKLGSTSMRSSIR